VNDAVAYIRSLAQLRGRNSDWAEQAVRGAVSLSAQDALAQHVVEMVARDVPDLLMQLNGRKVRISEHELTLDTQGLSGSDLDTLDSSQLSYEVTTSRQILRSRYGAPVNWFSYPLGDYDATVIAAVRAAGYVGSTTVVPGWASPQQDRFRLPRLQVLSGTTGPQLLAQIDASKADASAPSAYTAA